MAKLLGIADITLRWPWPYFVESFKITVPAIYNLKLKAKVAYG